MKYIDCELRTRFDEGAERPVSLSVEGHAIEIRMTKAESLEIGKQLIEFGKGK